MEATRNGRFDRPRGAGLTALILAIVLMGTVGAASAQTIELLAVGAYGGLRGTVSVDVMISDVSDLRGFSLYVQFEPDRRSSKGARSSVPTSRLRAPRASFFRRIPGERQYAARGRVLLGCSLTDHGSQIRAADHLRAWGDQGRERPDHHRPASCATRATTPIALRPVAGSIANICNTAPVIAPAELQRGREQRQRHGGRDRPGQRHRHRAAGRGGPSPSPPATRTAASPSTPTPASSPWPTSRVLDFETNQSFALTVLASDDDPNTIKSSSATITINLNDVNEAPVLGAIGDQVGGRVGRR